MSSIVKAVSLFDLPSNENSSIAKNGNIRQEIESQIREELNERRESIIRQAIRKSQQIDNEATKRANALIEEALASSRSIMIEAERKGYEEGYLRGLIDGVNAAEKKAEEGLNEIRQLTELIRTERSETFKRQENDLQLIAFEIAKKIMRQQVQTDENAIPKMLEEIIQENETGIKIYLSEYNKTLDLHIDKSIAKKISSISGNTKVIMIKEDDIIMVETENGVVDLSLPAQLELLKGAIGVK